MHIATALVPTQCHRSLRPEVRPAPDCAIVIVVAFFFQQRVPLQVALRHPGREINAKKNDLRLINAVNDRYLSLAVANIYRLKLKLLEEE